MADIPPRGDQEHQGGVLEDRRQRHHRVPLAPVEHQVRHGDAERGLPAQDLLVGLLALGGLKDGHLQPRIAVKAFFQGRVVPRELKLVFPLQGERDRSELPALFHGRRFSRGRRGGKLQEECKKEENEKGGP